jgi:peptidoglycan-N-acetylglucosamine deacetylase
VPATRCLLPLLTAALGGTVLTAPLAPVARAAAAPVPHHWAAPPHRAARGCRWPAWGPQYYAPGPGRTVALTFDDGPGRSTRAILNVLRRYRVTATFFNVGEWEAARWWLVKAEARAGFALGNHTWDHPDLRTLPPPAQAAQIDRTSTEQQRLTGRKPCLFRPPYGAYNTWTLRLAHRRRLAVWQWSVDTEDWQAQGSGSSYWVHRIIGLAEAEGGRLRNPVVLMHNQPAGNPATAAALPAVIRFFRRHHYRFVAL